MNTNAVLSEDAHAILQQWCNGIKLAHIAHQRASAQYKQQGRILGLLVTAGTILIGTSAFTSLSTSRNTLVLILVGIVSVVTAVLSGVNTFLNYPELASKHYSAAVKYGELRRKMDEIIAIKPSETELKKLFPEIRHDWKKLEDESPEIPQRFHDQALRKIKMAD